MYSHEEVVDNFLKQIARFFDYGMDEIELPLHPEIAKECQLTGEALVQLLLQKNPILFRYKLHSTFKHEDGVTYYLIHAKKPPGAVATTPSPHSEDEEEEEEDDSWESVPCTKEAAAAVHPRERHPEQLAALTAKLGCPAPLNFTSALGPAHTNFVIPWLLEASALPLHELIRHTSQDPAKALFYIRQVAKLEFMVTINYTMRDRVSAYLADKLLQPSPAKYGRYTAPPGIMVELEKDSVKFTEMQRFITILNEQISDKYPGSSLLGGFARMVHRQVAHCPFPFFIAPDGNILAVLFHGTDPKSGYDIRQKGFKPQLLKFNGAKLGSGFYFTIDFDLATKYPSEKIEHPVLVCLVFLGKCPYYHLPGIESSTIDNNKMATSFIGKTDIGWEIVVPSEKQVYVAGIINNVPALRL
jgi:hypothetical protein